MMFCDGCGAQLSANQSFCSTCGKPVRPGMPPFGAAVPAMGSAVQLRVLHHAKVAGILWLIYSIIHLLPGLFLIGFSHFMSGYLPSDVPIFVPGILHFIGIGISLASIVGVIAGWGLLSWKPWARVLTIVISFLHLLNFPLGTALGIYSLWVLLPAESEQRYREQSAVAANS